MDNAIVNQKCTAYRKALMKDSWLRAEFESLMNGQVTSVVDMLVVEYRRYILKEIRKRKRIAEKHAMTIDMFD